MSANTSPPVTDALFCPDPDVICQRMGKVIVLLNLRTDRFYELNPTAARVWELVSEQADTSLIENTLLSEFEVEPVQLGNDIRMLIASLKQEGLIVNSAPQLSREGQS